MDELVAWTEVRIPDTVLRGETHEEWYSLSGKQGEGVEGMIDLVLSFTVSSASMPRTFSNNNQNSPLTEYSDAGIQLQRRCSRCDGSKRGRSTVARIHQSTTSRSGESSTSTASHYRG